MSKTTSLPAGAAEARRAKAAQLGNEVRALAAREGVEVIESTTRRARAIGLGDGRRVVVIPPVRGMSSYATALHELGHHLAANGTRGRRLEREVAAWRWALENATVPLTIGARRAALRSLYSYAFWAAERQFRRRPPAMPDGDFHAVAVALCGRSPRLIEEERRLQAQIAARAERARGRGVG